MRYAIAIALNAIDGSLTAAGMALGILSEANPLLAWMPAMGILAYKLVPTTAMLLWVSRHRDRVLVQRGMLLVCATYCHILVLHLSWLATIG